MSDEHPTPTERLYRIAMQLAYRQPKADPVSKVSLTLNAKGDTQIEVDVNHTDPQTAAMTASDIYEVLRAKYPRENGNGAA
jgi:hypothetical protein